MILQGHCTSDSKAAILLAQMADAHLHMPGCVRSVRLGCGVVGGGKREVGGMVIWKHTSRARVGVEEESDAALPQETATSVVLLIAPDRVTKCPSAFSDRPCVPLQGLDTRLLWLLPTRKVRYENPPSPPTTSHPLTRSDYSQEMH